MLVTSVCCKTLLYPLRNSGNSDCHRLHCSVSLEIWLDPSSEIGWLPGTLDLYSEKVFGQRGIKRNLEINAKGKSFYFECSFDCLEESILAASKEFVLLMHSEFGTFADHSLGLGIAD